MNSILIYFVIVSKIIFINFHLIDGKRHRSDAYEECRWDHLTVDENEPPDTILCRIPDYDTRSILYKLNSDGNTIMKLNDHGMLMLRMSLDFEKQTTYTFGYTVVNFKTRRNTTSSGILRVLDINDNEPYFESSGSVNPQHISVQENTTLNTIIAEVEARDKDYRFNRNSLSMRILFMDDGEFFQLGKTDQYSRNEFASVKGSIYLQKKLDYETKKLMKVFIRADDRKTNVKHEIQVHVIDVQDTPPKFLELPLKPVSVLENADVGTLVHTIRAVDGDIFLPREKKHTIQYFLEATADSKSFTLDKYSGEIRTKTTFDVDYNLNSSRLRGKFEERPKTRYELSVIAKEIGCSNFCNKKAEIKVAIEDVNDKSPSIIIPFKEYQLPEYFPRNFFIPLEIAVEDLDLSNTHSKYSIQVNDTRFTVDPNYDYGYSKINLKVNDPRELDPQKWGAGTAVPVKITARDTDSSIEVSEVVIIKISNRVDLPPRFIKPIEVVRGEYHVNITEDQGPGTLVANIKAIDPDNGTISYYLVDGSGMFRLSSDFTKLLTVKPFDCETSQTHTVTVFAEDLTLRRSNLDIIVNVIDVNDEKPKFLMLQSTFSVGEKLPSDRCIGEFQVVDADVTSPNNDVIIEVIDVSTNFKSVGSHAAQKLFSLDVKKQETIRNPYEYHRSSMLGAYSSNSMMLQSTGSKRYDVCLKANKLINYDTMDTDFIMIQLQATDKGRYPRSLRSEATITLQIEDRNDHAPVFISPRDLTASVTTFSNSNDINDVKKSDEKKKPPINKILNFTMPTNMSRGELVGRIRATDGDRSLQYGPSSLVYNIDCRLNNGKEKKTKLVDDRSNDDTDKNDEFGMAPFIIQSKIGDIFLGSEVANNTEYLCEISVSDHYGRNTNSHITTAFILIHTGKVLNGMVPKPVVKKEKCKNKWKTAMIPIPLFLGMGFGCLGGLCCFKKRCCKKKKDKKKKEKKMIIVGKDADGNIVDEDGNPLEVNSKMRKMLKNQERLQKKIEDNPKLKRATIYAIESEEQDGEVFSSSCHMFVNGQEKQEALSNKSNLSPLYEESSGITNFSTLPSAKDVGMNKMMNYNMDPNQSDPSMKLQSNMNMSHHAMMPNDGIADMRNIGEKSLNMTAVLPSQPHVKLRPVEGMGDRRRVAGGGGAGGPPAAGTATLPTRQHQHIHPHHQHSKQQQHSPPPSPRNSASYLTPIENQTLPNRRKSGRNSRLGRFIGRDRNKKSTFLQTPSPAKDNLAPPPFHNIYDSVAGDEGGSDIRTRSNNKDRSTSSNRLSHIPEFQLPNVANNQNQSQNSSFDSQPSVNDHMMFRNSAKLTIGDVNPSGAYPHTNTHQSRETSTNRPKMPPPPIPPPRPDNSKSKFQALLQQTESSLADNPQPSYLPSYLRQQQQQHHNAQPQCMVNQSQNQPPLPLNRSHIMKTDKNTENSRVDDRAPLCDNSQNMPLYTPIGNSQYSDQIPPEGMLI